MTDFPRRILTGLLLAALFCAFGTDLRVQEQSESARILFIGAHPDDADVKAGGTAALLADHGHAVKFVSLTNGDAGHHEMGGGMLAERRRAESKEAARHRGIDAYEVLHYHDGELMPTLEVRLRNTAVSPATPRFGGYSRCSATERTSVGRGVSSRPALPTRG